MSRRGPYRKRSRLAVEDTRWHRGETLTVNGLRWIIRTVNDATGAVTLTASNLTNHAIQWTTTLDKLPTKASNS